MKILIPCPCGNPDHPHTPVYDPSILHHDLADLVRETAGFTYGDGDEPPGEKGEIDILHNPLSDGNCEVWDAIYDGKNWRNTHA